MLNDYYTFITFFFPFSGKVRYNKRYLGLTFRGSN